MKILARKDLAEDRVELKYQMLFGNPPQREQTKIVEMIKTNGAWLSGATRGYDTGWENGSQPEPLP